MLSWYIFYEIDLTHSCCLASNIEHWPTLKAWDSIFGQLGKVCQSPILRTLILFTTWQKEMCSGWLSAKYWVRVQTPLHGPSAGTGKLWGGGGFTSRIRITKQYNCTLRLQRFGWEICQQSSTLDICHYKTELWTVDCRVLRSDYRPEPSARPDGGDYQAQHNLQFCRLGVQWNCQTENLLNHHYYFPCGTLKWHTVRNCVWSAPPAPALRFQTEVMSTNFCKFLWYIMFRLPYNVQLAVSSQRTIISNQRFRRLDLE